MPAPSRISPSLVARYFFHDCERFLRYMSTPAQRRKGECIPEHRLDTGTVMDAILDAGYGWEEQVVGKLLRGQVLIANGGAESPIREQRFTLEETLQTLRSANPGSYVYQASLRVPTGFYERFGIDPARVHFSDNHPDLIAVEQAEGRRRFRVIDIKRGDTAKAIHRIQILLYALELRDVLKAAGIEGEVDLAVGQVWLGNAADPLDLDLNPVRPHVERFLRADMPRICSAPADRAEWHLHFRCEWCEFFEHCQQTMRDTDDLSRLAGLTAFGKRFLSKQDVRTVANLGQWLTTPGAEDTLRQCASLAGRGHLLRNQAKALSTMTFVPQEASSMSVPIGENVGVFITAQEEPLGQICYLAGVLVQVREDLREMVIGQTESPEPEVWVATAPDEADAVAGCVIAYLDQLFENVANYNRDQPWGEQLSLQCYVHNERERAVFSRLLIAALDDPLLKVAAMRLLLHFSSPDLANADKQPKEPAPYPLTVLIAAQTQLVALPVDTSYTLSESLQALGSAFDYARNPHVHFPLGHALRPDGIHKVWAGAVDITVVRNNARTLLYASRALLFALRQQLGTQLAAWPPKFAMPGTSGIRSPLLARLAFFTRFESVIGCLETRAVRAEARAVQLESGEVIELEAIDAHRFRILHGPADIGENTMPTWLLVTDDADGRLAQLRFPDYMARARRRYGRQTKHRALVGISEVEIDTAGIPKTLTVAWSQRFSTGLAIPGRRYLLLPRFLDYNTDRVIDWLKGLDGEDADALEWLVLQPSSGPLPLNAAVEKSVEARLASLGLTPSQSKAFQMLCRHDNVVVWGPPGTGKTHFVGAAVGALAAAHFAAGRPFRVLVTAFTHAAIENVLKSVAAVLERHFDAADVPVWKAGDWRGEQRPRRIVETDAHFEPLLNGAEQVVIGATVYACIKANPGRVFDLVVVDEASQVRLPEACIPLSLRRKGGRLLLAGDHQQLPPIVRGTWPDPANGPAIHGSILTTLRVEDHPALGLQLHENWRMNQTLTAVAADFIYGEQYHCASPDIAARRLRWTAPVATDPFIEYCLEPAFSLVMVVLDGVDAGKENQFEALLVARLARALRDGMSSASGTLYPDDDSFFHGTPKSCPGLFVVSPHHVQIAAIRKAVAGTGLTNPFVDTVEKMQGQEAEAVLISYGVSDPEFALREAAFIYGRNRLNVAITRARRKAVLFLPRPLLEAPPGVLDVEEALEGLAFMRQLHDLSVSRGDRKVFAWPDGISAEVLRYNA